MNKFAILALFAIWLAGPSGCYFSWTDPIIPNEVAIQQKAAIEAEYQSAEFFRDRLDDYLPEGMAEQAKELDESGQPANPEILRSYLDISGYATYNADGWKALYDLYSAPVESEADNE